MFLFDFFFSSSLLLFSTGSGFHPLGPGGAGGRGPLGLGGKGISLLLIFSLCSSWSLFCPCSLSFSWYCRTSLIVAYMFDCLSIYVSIYPSMYLSIHLSIYLSIYLSNYLSIYQSMFLSLKIFICSCMQSPSFPLKSIYPININLSTWLPIYLYLYIYLSTSIKVTSL